mmetsp:Transcript_14164/g.31465  ORF Transcript_14164/g.31465 Transcript_14164/m.31465 type:complete len:302 (-) Transcript_14164:1460-2365(-)
MATPDPSKPFGVFFNSLPAPCCLLQIAAGESAQVVSETSIGGQTASIIRLLELHGWDTLVPISNSIKFGVAAIGPGNPADHPVIRILDCASKIVRRPVSNTTDDHVARIPLGVLKMRPSQCLVLQAVAEHHPAEKVRRHFPGNDMAVPEFHSSDSSIHNSQTVPPSMHLKATIARDIVTSDTIRALPMRRRRAGTGLLQKKIHITRRHPRGLTQLRHEGDCEYHPLLHASHIGADGPLHAFQHAVGLCRTEKKLGIVSTGEDGLVVKGSGHHAFHRENHAGKIVPPLEQFMANSAQYFLEP